MLKSYFKKGVVEAGCDEAGRGCLAGPVFAASVILPPNYKNKILDDSKKLNEKKRLLLRLNLLLSRKAGRAPVIGSRFYLMNGRLHHA